MYGLLLVRHWYRTPTRSISYPIYVGICGYLYRRTSICAQTCMQSRRQIDLRINSRLISTSRTICYGHTRPQETMHLHSSQRTHSLSCNGVAHFSTKYRSLTCTHVYSLNPPTVCRLQTSARRRLGGIAKTGTPTWPFSLHHMTMGSRVRSQNNWLKLSEHENVTRCVS